MNLRLNFKWDLQRIRRMLLTLLSSLSFHRTDSTHFVITTEARLQGQQKNLWHKNLGVKKILKNGIFFSYVKEPFQLCTCSTFLFYILFTFLFPNISWCQLIVYICCLHDYRFLMCYTNNCFYIFEPVLWRISCLLMLVSWLLMLVSLLLKFFSCLFTFDGCLLVIDYLYYLLAIYHKKYVELTLYSCMFTSHIHIG